jgi:tetrahydromethanopterin S-methyltransferase subunit D
MSSHAARANVLEAARPLEATVVDRPQGDQRVTPGEDAHFPMSTWLLFGGLIGAMLAGIAGYLVVESLKSYYCSSSPSSCSVEGVGVVAVIAAFGAGFGVAFGWIIGNIARSRRRHKAHTSAPG